MSSVLLIYYEKASVWSVLASLSSAFARRKVNPRMHLTPRIEQVLTSRTLTLMILNRRHATVANSTHNCQTGGGTCHKSMRT